MAKLSPSRRGYGTHHRALREGLKPIVAAGLAVCARCGRPIMPGTPWDLGHVDGDKSRYQGPEHRSCNRQAGGTQGAEITNARPPSSSSGDHRQAPLVPKLECARPRAGLRRRLRGRLGPAYTARTLAEGRRREQTFPERRTCIEGDRQPADLGDRWCGRRSAYRRRSRCAAVLGHQDECTDADDVDNIKRERDSAGASLHPTRHRGPHRGSRRIRNVVVRNIGLTVCRLRPMPIARTVIGRAGKAFNIDRSAQETREAGLVGNLAPGAEWDSGGLRLPCQMRGPFRMVAVVGPYTVRTSNLSAAEAGCV
jgi:hypothetical protein